MTKSKKLEKKSAPAKKTNKKIVKADSKKDAKTKTPSVKAATAKTATKSATNKSAPKVAPKAASAKASAKEAKGKAAPSGTLQGKKSKVTAKTKSAPKSTTKKTETVKSSGKSNSNKDYVKDAAKEVSNETDSARDKLKSKDSTKESAKAVAREAARKIASEIAANVKSAAKIKSVGVADNIDGIDSDEKKNGKKIKTAKKPAREDIDLPPELDDDDGFGGADDFVDFEEPVAPRKVKPSVLDDTDSAEIILTDAEGRALCKVPNCDQRSNVEGYCRYHYLLFWKRIQVRKRILSEGKLEKYIEELTSRYPMKYLEMLKKDLRSIQDFLSAIQELEIDDSSSENEFEDEAQTFIDEVRGISSTEGDSDEEF